MSYDVASETLGLNFSDSVNETTTETSTAGSLASRVSRTNPIIIRVTIFLILAVFNLGGNGFTLITIRLTPRLWTKTNFILASMMVADIITGVVMFWYNPFLLVMYVFKNPCRHNVVITALTPIMKTTPLVSLYHLILVCIERYISIVYPLQYETKFTDRTLKWGIASAWATGILMGMTFSFWLINADLSKCELIPVPYHLLEVICGYVPVSICMFYVYGTILVISWRQRKRINPISVNPAPGTSVPAKGSTSLPSAQSGQGENNQDPRQLLAGTGRTVTNIRASSDVAQQQRQTIKYRRREFKAVYLTAAVVGMFFILWFPHVFARVLASVGYNPMVVNYVGLAAGAIGSANFAFTWVIYAAVSSSYRRAYRQLLVRIGCCCCKNIRPQVDNSSVV